MGITRVAAVRRRGLDRRRGFAYIRRMIRGIGYLGTFLFTRLQGQLVGTDVFGNRYFELRRARANGRPRRWVIYAGDPEASTVPPEWHSWLHYTTERPLTDVARHPWQKPHLANQTGTAHSYRPPGHDYEGGRRSRATGDYEAWAPGE